MIGQIEIHWSEQRSSCDAVKNKSYVFDPGKDDAASRMFNELKEKRGNYDIRLVRVERYASTGG